MVNDPHRLFLYETAQAAFGIGTYMGCQLVPPDVRQIVDQGRVAEVIVTLPIVAVRFEGIPAIGTENDRAAAGLQYANHFVHRHKVIVDMLDHFVR